MNRIISHADIADDITRLTFKCRIGKKSPYTDYAFFDREGEKWIRCVDGDAQHGSYVTVFAGGEFGTIVHKDGSAYGEVAFRTIEGG